MALGPQALNARQEYTIPLEGAPDPDAPDPTAPTSLAGHITGTETLSARLWVGGDYAPIAGLSAVWDAATIGRDSPSFTLTVPSGIVAEEGEYAVQVLLNPGTDDAEIYAGAIVFKGGSAGTAAAPMVYGTYRDLLKMAGWIGNVTDLARDSAGFLEQRADACRWLKRQVMARVRRALADQYGRHGAVVTVDPIVPPAGVDFGPGRGDSIYPETTADAQIAGLAALLDSTTPGVGLMTGAADPLDRDGGTAVRIVSHYAIHLILDGQVGSVNETPYQVLANYHRDRAKKLLIGWTAFLDADNDGRPDYQLLP